MQALIRRAHDLSIITERQYRYLFQQLSAKGLRIAEPLNLNVQVEKPRLIAKLAEIAYPPTNRFAKLAAEAHILEEEIRAIMGNFAGKEDFDDRPSPTSKVVTFRKKVKV